MNKYEINEMQWRNVYAQLYCVVCAIVFLIINLSSLSHSILFVLGAICVIISWTLVYTNEQIGKIKNE